MNQESKRTSKLKSDFDSYDINPPSAKYKEYKYRWWDDSNFQVFTLEVAIAATMLLWALDNKRTMGEMKAERDAYYKTAAEMIKNNTITMDSAGVPVERLVMTPATLKEYNETLKMAEIKTWQVETPWVGENDKPDPK